MRYIVQVCANIVAKELKLSRHINFDAVHCPIVKRSPSVHVCVFVIKARVVEIHPNRHVRNFNFKGSPQLVCEQTRAPNSIEDSRYQHTVGCEISDWENHLSSSADPRD